jgi:hypothetical protein
MASIAKILRVYHDEHGMVLQLANKPGEKGFGTHEMGGVAWGGHPCPGAIRAAQRSQILALASGSTTTDPLEEIMGWYASKDEFESAVGRSVKQAPVDAKGTTLAQCLRQIRAGLDPAELAAAIAAKMPAGTADLAKMTAALRAVFADAGDGS